MSVRSILWAGACGFAFLIASWATPAPAPAQAVAPRAPAKHTELGGRVQFQWNSTSVDGEKGTEFLMRRARIWAATQINDWIDGAVEVDLSGATAVARTVFLRLSPSPAARISLGQTKRAFDVFELTSSADILVVERDGDVRGAFSCAGVGGVCSFSRFSEKLQLSSQDVGVFLQGEAAGRVGAVEPLARVSWGDPDSDAASDGGLLLTPGIVLYFQGKNKIGANVDVWRPEHGDAVWGLKAQTYLYF